ncbi:hypothetical protein N7492_001853 [Penicillium capsulatum]|uniref:Uncharacterized protein n=1 Tax=Penicillium capsulatum TaxID=69766 RepID=A0A9W9M1L1_9EURO|nr:hypothetical protein N7492_001853 [Penicillium capsulatum]KAJ6129098.1 hypothetical protein N7512_001878 [Penicillium capsulatum]
MSWDRVIQDSDEDEPLIEDDVPASIDPLQGAESSMQHEYDHRAAAQQANCPESISATELQLSVNFDHYLQSQDGLQGQSTLSQQQREARWIPSTSEGGGGSTGDMMTEIGAAQQRLFDDEVSSAGQPLPSTATAYPSEISQPGSFPTVESFQYQHGGNAEGLAYGQAQQDVPYETTQLTVPVEGRACDYDTPATSNHIDSPVDELLAQTNIQPVHAHIDYGTPDHLLRESQQVKGLQHATDSPHDTEPISSVASRGLNSAKKDNEGPGLLSPQHSQTSAHDELSMPAVAVEVSSVQKKRARPKKQPMPEDDEDDELSLPMQDEFDRPKPVEKRAPGRPPKSVETVEGPQTKEAGGEDAKTPDPLSASPNDATAVAEEPMKPAAKESKKKKKAKRSKTDSEILPRSHKPAIDDDLVWVDSRPLQPADGNARTEPSAKIDPKSETDPSRLAEDSNTIQPEPAPIPKKRGRKRKNAPDEASAQTTPAPEQPNTPRPEDPTLCTDAEPTAEGNEVAHTESRISDHPPAQTDESTKSNAPPETPNISTPNKTTQRHSPISSTSKVPYRVGLSRRARIAPLLKVVRK